MSPILGLHGRHTTEHLFRCAVNLQRLLNIARLVLFSNRDLTHLRICDPVEVLTLLGSPPEFDRSIDVESALA